MIIHISRNGGEIAVVTREVVEAAILGGTFWQEDLGWSEGGLPPDEGAFKRFLSTRTAILKNATKSDMLPNAPVGLSIC
jgi:hypothetical protein